MLTPEEADLLLTPRDLSAYVSEEVRKAGAEQKIVVDCLPEELRLTSASSAHGLSIAVDTFGRWTISPLILADSDGEYVPAGRTFSTEKTLTVIRAIARWISGAMTEHPEDKKTRFRLVIERTPAT